MEVSKQVEVIFKKTDSQSALADTINHFLTEQAARLDSQSALADTINHFLTEQAGRLDSQSA